MRRLSIILLVIFGCGFLGCGLKDDRIKKEVEESQIVLIDFYSETCPPCRRLKPVIDSLEAEYKGRIQVMRVDVMKEGELSEEYEVEYLPTVIVFYDGIEFVRIVGFHKKAEYQMYLDELIDGNMVDKMIKFESN